MTQVDFRRTFFEEIVKEQLGYIPSIMIAPAHLANGFFREVGGGYYNNEALHWAVYAKTDPIEGPNPPNTKSRFGRFTVQQQNALQVLSEDTDFRNAIAEAFGADRTLFRSVNLSSYSVSHVWHTTNDNHDREAGKWLCDIVQHGDLHPAYDLLYILLTQNAMRTDSTGGVVSDALSVVSLPFIDESHSPKRKSLSEWPPKSLSTNESGLFQNDIVNAIRTSFDQLTANDSKSALKNGKLDCLRRMTTLGCFSVYLHLINIGGIEQRVPMLLNLSKGNRTLKGASQASFQAIIRSIEHFFTDAIRDKLGRLVEEGGIENLDNETAYQFIREQINWYRNKPTESEKTKVQGFIHDCVNFYDSYRGEAAAYTPIDAISYALTDMIGLVFSAKPYDVARNLGVKIGLLTRGDRTTSKAYELHPDLLEVLVRATVPPGEEWTIVQLAHAWWKRFGILFGGLGYENEVLAKWSVSPVDYNELALNVQELEKQLEMSGYAHRYADGVVLIRIAA